MNKSDLALLRPEDFTDRDVLVEDILAWFDACDSYWYHSGDRADPHVVLTSGKHSNGFFDCLGVLENINLSEILASQLARKIRRIIGQEKIHWVIGSPMAGITFAYATAKALGAEKMFFTEKNPAGEGMLWRRRTIPEGAIVLQIEELITTAKTVNSVRQAVEIGNKYPVTWLPLIGVLVHRPDHLPLDFYGNFYGNRRVVPLVEKEVWAEFPDTCPLCALGSECITEPKKRENWARLTKKNY